MKLNNCDKVCNMTHVFEKGQNTVETHQLEGLILAEGNQERLHERDDKLDIDDE